MDIIIISIGMLSSFGWGYYHGKRKGYKKFVKQFCDMVKPPPTFTYVDGTYTIQNRDEIK